MIITVDRVEFDHGSIVDFAGVDEQGNNVLVAVDHRMAEGLADLVFADGEVDVEAEGWQVRRNPG